MKKLSKQEDIIITKADKGSAIVIVDVKDFIKEDEPKLKNTENYRKRTEIRKLLKLVNDTIERFKKQKLMNANVTEGLKRNDPKNPKFYLRPKIHKESNPSCLVISSVNCHTANISKYVDYLLQHIVKEIPSYVRRTKFYQKIRDSKRYNSREPSTIIFIFWDSLMFYQMFLLPQVKRFAIITNKYGIYELHNDLRLRKYYESV